MLSYMLPTVEDKTAPHNLNLDLSVVNGNALPAATGRNGTTTSNGTSASSHRRSSGVGSGVSNGGVSYSNGNPHRTEVRSNGNGNHIIMTTTTATTATATSSTTNSGGNSAPMSAKNSAARNSARLIQFESNTAARPPLPVALPPSALRNAAGAHPHHQPHNRLDNFSTTANSILVQTPQSQQQQQQQSQQQQNQQQKPADSEEGKRPGRLPKAGGTKGVTLKRVSFGSSKGSMVETLVYETPTPLPEHAEREFAFSIGGTAAAAAATTTTASGDQHSQSHSQCLDDSGIEMAEELERSKVRVTFFQSGKPQQISPPDPAGSFDYDDPASNAADDSWKQFDPLDPAFDQSNSSSSNQQHQHHRLQHHQHHHHHNQHDADDALDVDHTDGGSRSTHHNMTAATAQMPSYDRQMSTESGWDNPFRPGGDLSREADEIVNMIKGGKPITPTGENGTAGSAADAFGANGTAHSANGNGTHSNGNGTTVVDGVVLATAQNAASQLQAASPPNGASKSPAKAAGAQSADTAGAVEGQTQIAQQRLVPGPQSATHVIVDDKKKKKCACCVIQ